MTSSMARPKKEFAGQSVLYEVKNRVAYIILNRPERYNAIDENTPVELDKAVTFANMDDEVKVIIFSMTHPNFYLSIITVSV